MSSPPPRRGTLAAGRIVDRAAAAIARMVHELVLAYDVELVVIGGGISRAGGPLLERVQAGLDRIGAPSPFAAELLAETDVRLVGSDHDVGTRGAIALLGPTRRGWSHAKPSVEGTGPRSATRGRPRSVRTSTRGGAHR